MHSQVIIEIPNSLTASMCYNVWDNYGGVQYQKPNVAIQLEKCFIRGWKVPDSIPRTEIVYPDGELFEEDSFLRYSDMKSR
jgi:hypothetical protein